MTTTIISPRRSQRLTQDSENDLRCERPLRNSNDKQLRSVNRIIEETADFVEPRKTSPTVRKHVNTPTSIIVDSSTEKQCPIFVEILQWQTTLSKARSLLGKYEIDSALRELNAFRETELDENARVLELRGLAHFENGHYNLAVGDLMRIRELYPWHTSGMAMLSTALWFLRDEYTLSALSSELSRCAPGRAETWCVAANCFSLKHEREQTIECLHKAIQLEPKYAYAYSLLGHELVEGNKLDAAQQAFRNAIRLCPRDYRSHFGLGNVYLKKEQMAEARQQYNRALQLHPRSAETQCSLSKTSMTPLHREMAVKALETILMKDPENIHCLYNLAEVELKRGRVERARELLEGLKARTTDEAEVFYLLARVHRQLGNAHQSNLYMSHASNLNPRGDHPGFYALSPREDSNEDLF